MERRLRDNRSGGPSRMMTEHLQQWILESRKAEAEDDTSAETGAGSMTRSDTRRETATDTDTYREM